MKKLFLFFISLCLLQQYVSSQIVVKLTLPANCSDNTVTTLVEKLEESNSAEISVFPNPNEGSFILNASFFEPINEATIKVFNLSGEMVYMQPIYCNSLQFVSRIDLKVKPAGVYILTISSQQKIISTRFIIK